MINSEVIKTQPQSSNEMQNNGSIGNELGSVIETNKPTNSAKADLLVNQEMGNNGSNGKVFEEPETLTTIADGKPEGQNEKTESRAFPISSKEEADLPMNQLVEVSSVVDSRITQQDPQNSEQEHQANDVDVVRQNSIGKTVAFTNHELSTSQSSEDTLELLEPMVKVEHGRKSYGSHTVLENLNLTVQQRSIYALLGASGCGKTTILSCIVGINTLNSGYISFCGENLKHIINTGGLRKQVGYMPQELALYKEFTIKEALMYFGRIYRMKESTILKQIRFLVKFLQLPDWNTEIRQMSGGQQRRTSFAVALLHSPKLLILDEPTVGVDALLRKSIWKHLTNLVANHGTTVIITTHYIEEASAANKIGLMRSGRILAEGSPENLLENYQCPSLEALFLKLSEIDEAENKKLDNRSINSSEDELLVIIKSTTTTKTAKSQTEKARKRGNLIFPYSGYFSRLHALVMKNFVYISRQMLFIFFLLLFPAIQVGLCCWAIGGEPWGIPFGIINYEEEVNNYTCKNHTSSTALSPMFCITNSQIRPEMLSCDYIERLSNKTRFNLMTFDSEDDALDKFKWCKISGYFSIPKDFTQLILSSKAKNNTTAMLNVQLDMTSRHISLSIQKVLGETLQGTFKSLTSGCPSTVMGPSEDSGPIKYEKPLYGHTDQSILIEYVGPGLVLGVIFFAAISVTGLSYVVEKKEGMLERSIVAGVTTSEVITAQLLSQCVIVIIQTIICLVVLFGVFNVPNHGPIYGVVAITILQGFLGMFAGFVLSSVCDEEKVVMQWSVAITLPMVVIAGIFWPIAGMPTVLKYMAYIFVPQTLASESVRSMLARGWGVLHPNVWPGFAITIGYSIGLWIIATIFAKRSVSPKN